MEKFKTIMLWKHTFKIFTLLSFQLHSGFSFLLISQRIIKMLYSFSYICSCTCMCILNYKFNGQCPSRISTEWNKQLLFCQYMIIKKGKYKCKLWSIVLDKIENYYQKLLIVKDFLWNLLIEFRAVPIMKKIVILIAVNHNVGSRNHVDWPANLTKHMTHIFCQK